MHYTCLKPQARLGGSVFKLCEEGSTLGIKPFFYKKIKIKKKVKKNPVLLKERALSLEVSCRNMHPSAFGLPPQIDGDQKLLLLTTLGLAWISVGFSCTRSSQHQRF